jgi:hypothetical protein
MADLKITGEIIKDKAVEVSIQGDNKCKLT